MCEQENDPEIENIVVPRGQIENLETLRKIVTEMVNTEIPNKKEMAKFIKAMNKKYKTIIKNTHLLYAYRIMCFEGFFKEEKKYVLLMQSKGGRGESGVMVYGLVTSPYPNGQEFSCEWDCKYCPKEPNMPRSYTNGEPGVDRAVRNNYDPIRQFRDRANSYIANGHSVDKGEVIILGGTWHSYPSAYRDEFIRSIYFAANTYFDSMNIEELREPLSLDEEMKINETAKCHIIGITIETRPDCITPRELIKLRTLGVTRVQMGLQHIDDRILERVNRGCTLKHAIRAIKLLLDSGFKFDIHVMPDLPKPLKLGVNPKKFIERDDIDWEFDVFEADMKMFEELRENPYLQADQYKIYPFQVVKFSEMKDEYERGLHIPYSEEIAKEPLIVGEGGTVSDYPFTKLDELLIYILAKMPDHIRVNRVLRDNPRSFIIAGAKDLNKCQKITNEMEKRNLVCNDIRNSEVKNKIIDTSNAILIVEEREASDGMEYHLQFRTFDKKILLGFLRLRLSVSAGMDGDNIVF
ncbi:MAG: radical SAM protein, partial [Proteobacteria bacterium]|nr:radical SAM protein [Pseudomonadota bacterium]